MPVSSKEFHDIQATIECGFTLKRIRDMIRTYSVPMYFWSCTVRCPCGQPWVFRLACHFLKFNGIFCLVEVCGYFVLGLSACKLQCLLLAFFKEYSNPPPPKKKKKRDESWFSQQTWQDPCIHC